MSKLKIRRRRRVNSSPKEGLRQEWTEYQVVDGRKVIGRFDLLAQAQDAYPDAVFSEKDSHTSGGVE